MGRLVRACRERAEACLANTVPDDEQITAGPGQTSFTERWDWLRQALESARNDTPAARQASMAHTNDRLAELAQEASGDLRPSTPDFAQARRTVDEVLRRPEFQAAAPPSAWDRLMAKVWAAIYRAFAGVGRLGTMAPWLGSALEWLFFSGAAVGLLLFLRRNFQRQRLQAHLRGMAPLQGAWEREAADWARLAETSAAAGEWREAVHSLYWAAIVRLESRRAWRHNPTRTPREYVRLLKPGSVQRESLRGLTGLLERVWYGLRPAMEDDYQQARRWFERLGETVPTQTAVEAAQA